ncbi:TetR/AcrR family transcriptional regulator [Streptomyces sp. SAS_275]|uniref:TetR/AcrR family transcriptional regulator n=1 Tax=Streptomyces sp. SAS_275 TaxID=3412746 RepID=UPI00403D53B9
MAHTAPRPARTNQRDPAPEETRQRTAPSQTAPRRPQPTATTSHVPAKASPRNRLLDAAAELFAKEGVSASTDALCRAAGVSKRSMYELFSGKDEIIAASLERTVPTLTALLIPAPDEPESARERLLYPFRQLESMAPAPDFHGCPCMSTMIELKDPGHPATRIAARYKDEIKRFFQDEAERGGAGDPVSLARQLSLVYDGAAARAGTNVERLDGLALATASALIDAADILR